MAKTMKKVKKFYGEKLFAKGMEIVGVENPTPERLECTIKEYMLSEEFTSSLREGLEEIDPGKNETFDKMMEIEDRDLRVDLIHILAIFLEKV